LEIARLILGFQIPHRVDDLGKVAHDLARADPSHNRIERAIGVRDHGKQGAERIPAIGARAIRGRPALILQKLR
jgi:hypothetical protein